MDHVTPIERKALDEVFKSEAEKQHIARKEMALSAKTNQDRRYFKGGDGYKEMEVHADSFHHWGQKLGYDCWNDETWKKEYRRDVPESRVKSRPVNPAISFTGISQDRLDALYDPKTGKMRGADKKKERVA